MCWFLLALCPCWTVLCVHPSLGAQSRGLNLSSAAHVSHNKFPSLHFLQLAPFPLFPSCPCCMQGTLKSHQTRCQTQHYWPALYSEVIPDECTPTGPSCRLSKGISGSFLVRMRGSVRAQGVQSWCLCEAAGTAAQQLPSCCPLLQTAPCSLWSGFSAAPQLSNGALGALFKPAEQRAGFPSTLLVGEIK